MYAHIKILSQWPVARPSGHETGKKTIRKLKIRSSGVEACVLTYGGEHEI
jgi:hypothetical protein